MASANGTHGMNWIRQEKRLAIYLRDGLACAYCGGSDKLTLDHLTPHSRGGSNKETNLVTCCHKCNSRRGDKPLTVWCKSKRMVAKVMFQTTLPLDKAGAKRMIDRQGSAKKVLETL